MGSGFASGLDLATRSELLAVRRDASRVRGDGSVALGMLGQVIKGRVAHAKVRRLCRPKDRREDRRRLLHLSVQLGRFDKSNLNVLAPRVEVHIVPGRSDGDGIDLRPNKAPAEMSDAEERVDAGGACANVDAQDGMITTCHPGTHEEVVEPQKIVETRRHRRAERMRW